MAGAMTIPIKARAIKKSCIIQVPIQCSAVQDARQAKPVRNGRLFEKETPQRESPRRNPMPKAVVQPNYQSIIGGMRGILK